jgi:hypothetical protein
MTTEETAEMQCAENRASLGPMSRTHIQILVLLFVGFMVLTITGSSRASQLQSDPKSWVGCYAVTLGTWVPPMDLGRERQFIAPTTGLHLLAKRLSKRGAPFPTTHLVEPIVDPKQSVYEGNYWQILDDGRVRITWTNGFSSLTMNLLPEGQNLRGTALTFWDNGSREFTAEVVLTRIECGTPSA